MSADPVRAIARAVLYEGYLLWPYRRSALKNQQRFTFGGIHPERFAGESGDRCALHMECLVEGPPDASVQVELRCLHLVERQPARARDGGYEPVDELLVRGERHLAWEEATEREVAVGPLTLAELDTGAVTPVTVPAGEQVEELEDGAVLIRRWERLEGMLACSAEEVAPGIRRLCVAFANRSDFAGIERGPALARTFLSTHVVATAAGASFYSQTDPPEELRAHADACRNEGVWPVLAGVEGERHTVLGSPIILSDYPAVAPESPGDLFDGGEIDALLIHSLRGLSDAERDELCATDPRVREILERSMGLSPERMADLYGAVREMRPVES